MRKEIWFVHRLGPIEVLAGTILVGGIATMAGVWVTTAAKQVFTHPMDNLPYTILVLALYLVFNGVLIGLCCAATLCVFKIIYAAACALCRLLRGVLAQPIHLANLIAASLSALINAFQSIRRRLSR